MRHWWKRKAANHPKSNSRLPATAANQVALATGLAAKACSALVEFRRSPLPVQNQNVYRILLTIPLGASGGHFAQHYRLCTFGTFMPILVAPRVS